MDEWITRNRLEPTDILIDDDFDLKKKKKTMNDDKKLEV